MRSFALIFEETYKSGRHRVLTAAEGVRDPEHAGAFTVFVARPRNLWYRDFAASWTLGVRFQWLGVPKTPFARLVYTRWAYCTVDLAGESM